MKRLYMHSYLSRLFSPPPTRSLTYIHIIIVIEMLALLAASTLAVSGAMAQILPSEFLGLR
jgi:hypothetical protein